jgi:hypothetical protein
MRRFPLLALLVVAGCGAPIGLGEGGCTAIGALVGVSVDIAPRPADPEISGATLEACWADECQTHPVALNPSTTTGEETCTGDKPTDVCSVGTRETGGKNGFVAMPDLPTAPVQLTLTVTDAAGVQLATQTLDVTPETVYPNGPECPPGGPQARLTVDSTGKISAG